MSSNVQQTSIESFHDLDDLSTRQAAIYMWIDMLKNATNLEISHKSHIPINQVTPRTNELVKMGYVEQFEKRTCKVSGRTAIAWRVMPR